MPYIRMLLIWVMLCVHIRLTSGDVRALRFVQG